MIAYAGQRLGAERSLQVPVAQRTRLGRQAGCGVEQRQCLGGAFLLQQVGGEVEPGAGVVRGIVDGPAQQGFAGLRLAGDAQEGAEIGGRDGVARGTLKRLAHRRLGVLDGALAVARQPVIDPGLRPGGGEPDGGGEGLLGPRG